MTLKERVIVTAYTGVAMVCGKELSHFYAYADRLLGGPHMTHDFTRRDTWDALKEKSKDDFVALCKSEAVTNADRIRAMSDEELVNVVPCPLGFSMFRCPIDRKCGDCKREWLQQPAEEGTK